MQSESSARTCSQLGQSKDTRTEGYTAPESGVWVGEKRLVSIHRVKGRLCFTATAKVINREG